MNPKKMVRMLQGIDRRLRVCWAPGKVSGLYFWQPKHPEAHENGLRHIGAIPSASWFLSLPEKDFYTKGQHFCLSGIPKDELIKDWEFHRGWKSVLKKLGEDGHFDKSKLSKIFGWDIFVPGIAGTLSMLPGWTEKSRIERNMAALGNRG